MTSGILNVNKPRGMTSFSVVSLVRRLTGVRRVGHAGTLDPMADGVLPICLGQTTRVVEYLVGAPKSYHALVHLGVATNTFDSEGTVVATGDLRGVTRERLEVALAGFVGEIEQLAPMYSALKHEGQPLYRYARAGKTVPRTPRIVQIYHLELRRFDPPVAELEMVVGRGAYVRSLAQDLGEALGCGAHLAALTRVRSGPFTVNSAISPDALRDAIRRDAWQDLLFPADRVLESWHAAILGARHSLDVRHGRPLVLSPAHPAVTELPLETPCRAYSTDGEFLGILRYRGTEVWHPERVFTAQ